MAIMPIANSFARYGMLAVLLPITQQRAEQPMSQQPLVERSIAARKAGSGQQNQRRRRQHGQEDAQHGKQQRDCACHEEQRTHDRGAMHRAGRILWRRLQRHATSLADVSPVATPAG
jgi:hypothetical protein